MSSDILQNMCSCQSETLEDMSRLRVHSYAGIMEMYMNTALQQNKLSFTETLSLDSPPFTSDIQDVHTVFPFTKKNTENTILSVTYWLTSQC